MPVINHDSDVYAWANDQAAPPRPGDPTRVAVEHIAQEIESMGKTEKRELIRRPRVLLPQLLKWRFQTGAERELAEFHPGSAPGSRGSSPR
jgi:hypothetical protein